MARTSAEMATLASRAMSEPATLSDDEIQSLGASALSSRQEDFDNDDELIVPVLGGKPADDNVINAPGFLPEAEVIAVDAESEEAIDPSILAAVTNISPKVLTDAFVAAMFGVVIPTRMTAMRMTEFTIGYLTDLAKRQATQ